jgi:regulator of sirC expression with transglutaminase-like and TPR domain
MADCARSLEIDPECADTYGVRGLIYYQQEQYGLALVDFERARELGHNLFWLDEEYAETCRIVRSENA